MTKINEALTAVILYSIMSYMLQLPNMYLGILISITATQINLLLPQNYKHTLLIYIPMMAFTLEYPNVTVPLMIGYTSTIFISLLSKEGCKLLYPIKNTTFTGPKNYLENDSKKDYAATTFLVVLMIITLAFSTNGMEIIDDINENADFNKYISYRDVTENNKAMNHSHYITIDAEDCRNMNITTKTENNTTTTIIRDYVG
ncbi:MAG: hypothetical protein Q4Q22_03915 [Methanosphaera sp.]|nr:hypothetical protein [Methanosphaera sp.]